METAPPTRHQTALVGDLTEGAGDGALVRATATVIEGPDLGLAFPLAGAAVRVGKSRKCDIVLSDSAVSKIHLQLSLEGSAVRVKDLGSTNGTYVGKSRVIESLVPAGSVVTVGRSRIHLKTDDAPMMLTPSTADHFGELYGRSVAMRQLFAVLERVAPKEVNVLIDGETGTGKELAARALHDHSGRGRGPMVVLDCWRVSGAR